MMISGVRIKVEGSPEKVQWVADALEFAFPGALTWRDLAEWSGKGVIGIDGRGSPLIEVEEEPP